MKIALSTFNDNLSVAFDFAETLLVFSVEDGIAKEKNEHLLQNVNPTARAAEIKKLDIEVLICGCISRCSYELLTQLGIEVISHVSGTVDEILAAYLKKEISKSEFCMPGFGRGSGRAGRCGQNRGFGRRHGKMCSEPYDCEINKLTKRGVLCQD